MNVVITGASSGLGLSLFQKFRTQGHSVLGTTHDGTLVNDKDWVYYHAGMDGTPIKELAKVVRERFDGHVNLLINNAGTNAICPFEELTPGFVQNILDVNFMAPVFITQALLPMMVDHGSVVNVISDASWRPMRHSLAYNCSKAALAMATRQMARELTKPKNISVFGINPGKMRGTEMSKYIDKRVQEVRGWTAAEARTYFENNSLTGLELDPVDVANLIYHLTSAGGLCEAMSGTVVDLVG